MSKIYRVLGALVLTTTAALSSPYGGVFVGAGLGVGALRSETKYVDNTTLASGKSTATKFGLYYQGHLGYLHEVGDSKTMIGGDVYVNGSSANKVENIGANGQLVAGTLQQKRSVGYGVALIAGKLVNPKVMIYARLGYEMSRYKMNLKLAGQQQKTFNKDYASVVPGVGLNYKVAHNVLVGVGYDYAGFASKKTVYTDAAQNIQVNPAEHRVMAKVSFVFNPFG
ncbi:outer membrane protein [Candidatus Paracaedibacter symbiosus]|uniref:outer membrane protein n=1 Tax=Candidatus Paracaedibacter symbiosus TaxID=244582 RepID=UPI000509421B|nr:outer membrane beta-barrel protein [Candidatus Paracaedibacter symbiosus]